MGRGKGNKTRNAHQKAHDHKQESALRLQGKTLRDISEELGISRETVRKDLAFLDKCLTDSAKEDIELLKRQIAEKFRWAQTESAIAWKFSQEPAQKMVQKLGQEGLEVTTTLEIRSGHAPHMSNYNAAVDKEARLFNLYKPAAEDNIDLTEFEKALAEQLQAAEQEHGT